MDDEQIDNAFVTYLQRKGYLATQLAFQDERKTSKLVANVSSTRSGNNPGTYKEGYSKLRSWIFSSVDEHKNDLLHILYPVFVHSCMELVSKRFAQEACTFFQNFRGDHEALHLGDLQKLEGLLVAHHLEATELAGLCMGNKISIRMCESSFELLLQYLDNTDSILVRGIVNGHPNLHVFPGLQFEEEQEVPVTANVQETLDAFNWKQIQCGAAGDSFEEKIEKEIVTEPQNAEAKGKDADAVKKRKAEYRSLRPVSKKVKKGKIWRAAGRGPKSKATAAVSVHSAKVELPICSRPEELELQDLEDLRNDSLPAVSFYSFINNHNSLNCASISRDGASVVGGFSNSSLKLWDTVKIDESFVSSESIMLSEKDGEDWTPGRPVETIAWRRLGNNTTTYTLLQGQAGPVYAADFSSDGEYLLSALADCTVRLWSLKLNANLVSYKAHTYPVWDLQYCPFGNYFASVSHDQTVRVWSMERLQPLCTMAGHRSDVDCVSWHVDCNSIATGSSDKTVRLWDVQTGECIRTFNGHRGMVLSLAMSPDGRCMVSGDGNGAIMMWDLGSGKCVTRFLGHTCCVWSLAFSGEGCLLASGSADSTVRLWDTNGMSKASCDGNRSRGARRGKLLKTFSVKSTAVHAIRFSRNLLLAVGASNPIRPTQSSGESNHKIPHCHGTK